MVTLVGVMLLTGGLAAGVMLGAVLGSVPLLHVLDGAEYVRVHQFTAARYEPFQPICVAMSALSALGLSVAAPTGTVRVLAIVSAVLAAAVMAVSATRNVPIKRELRALDAAAPPGDEQIDSLRDRWSRWSLVRTVAGVAVLVINVGVVAALLSGA